MMMDVVPGWRMHRSWRVYKWNGFTKKGLQTFCGGDVVFKVRSQGWGLEVGKLTPIFTQVGQTSCNDFELPRKRWVLPMQISFRRTFA